MVLNLLVKQSNRPNIEITTSRPLLSLPLERKHSPLLIEIPKRVNWGGEEGALKVFFLKHSPDDAIKPLSDDVNLFLRRGKSYISPKREDLYNFQTCR